MIAGARAALRASVAVLAKAIVDFRRELTQDFH
jgi:hypothetical protein